MALTSYSELQAEVLDAVDRSGASWTTRVQSAIRLAEADISTQMRVRQMVCRARATVTGEFTDLGSDFGGIRSLHIVGSPDQVVQARDPGEITRLNSLNATAGKPEYYAVIGETLQLTPIPDQSYTVEMIVSEDIPALSDANTTNWLLTRFPHVYLMASLTWLARTYIGSDPRLPDWQRGYGASLDAMKSADAFEAVGHRPQMRLRKFG